MSNDERNRVIEVTAAALYSVVQCACLSRSEYIDELLPKIIREWELNVSELMNNYERCEREIMLSVVPGEGDNGPK
jgi:hypothetical protein